MTLTVGSLFSGIGGIDLGLERAGMRVVWQSELDPYCSRVLAKHWPNVPNLGDVTLIDWSEVERPDVVCGGYPCQPFSLAGSRKGSKDARHLWPYMADAISALRPRVALLENVPGHLSLGFDEVLGTLAALGYDAEWDCVPAVAVGAPHRRDRVWIIATNVADAEGIGEWPRLREDHSPAFWRRRPADGSSTRGDWTTEPGVGRVAYGVSGRLDRLSALGNAVVPQVAEHVGRLIVEAVAS